MCHNIHKHGHLLGQLLKEPFFWIVLIIQILVRV